MNDLETSQLLRALRRLEVMTEAVREDLREVKIRLGLLEQQSLAVSSHTDRMELRLERIERRLERVNA